MPRIPLFRSRVVLALTCCVASAVCVGQTPASKSAEPVTVYVKAGHLFDSTSDKLRDNVMLVIEGERIAKVAPAGEVTIPAGATVVDLSQDWVLPGLIDCHTHLEARADQYDPINEVRDTPFMGGFNGVVNANKTLLAGFTSVRDVGTLEAGKYADLIAVTASPLDRIEVLEHVSFVMKGGKVYKDEVAAVKP